MGKKLVSTLPAGIILTLSLLLGLPAALNAQTRARFSLLDPAAGPFPSDQFTVPDSSQITGRRVALPLPDCTRQPADCGELQAVNTLDGFNIQPRINIAFDGPIHPASVTGKTVSLIELDATPRVIGINQVLWDPPSNTLYLTSDELLAQNTQYALIATNGITSPSGAPIQAAPELTQFLAANSGDYAARLRAGLDAAVAAGIPRASIITASVFTTMNVTAALEKIRDQVHASTPKPASLTFDGVRAVFPRANVSSLILHQQSQVSPPDFTDVTFNLSAPDTVPGAIGTIAYGTFSSPDYRAADGSFPPLGTRTGNPVPQQSNDLVFLLTLPSGPMPAKGWPVAISCHGFTSFKEIMLTSSAVMAKHGFATIAINAVGHGSGPLGTAEIQLTGGQQITVPLGGRSTDIDGNNLIASDEGLSSTGRASLRDGVRQTVVDLMQLVRVIQTGIDVDGDSRPDLDPSRVYSYGGSLGGMYGIVFQAIEPAIRAGAPSFAGGPFLESNRLGAFRPRIGARLQTRVPSLINSPGLTQIGGLPIPGPAFNENMPLRNLPPIVNDVPGALEIQRLLENQNWLNQPGDSVAYAPYLRKNPLPGNTARPVLLLLAKGDQTVPLPTQTAVVRAGDLANVTTYLRFDNFLAQNPAIPIRNPHVINIFSGPASPPPVVALAVALQEQTATFLETDGARILQPQPAAYFEVPIKLPLPENIEYFTAAPPPRTPVDAAAFESALSPGSLFTLFGTTNSPSPDSGAGAGNLPTSLGGIMVSVNGTPAPLLYVGRNQINGQIPYEIGAGPAVAQVIASGISGAQLPFAVTPAAPRLFKAEGNLCLAQNFDGTLNTDANPATRGRAIGVYMVGIGPVSPAVNSGAAAGSAPYSIPPGTVEASFGGRSVTPGFLGLVPGLVGVARMDLIVPEGLTAGLNGLSMTFAGAVSNTCQVAVGQ